MHGIRKVGQENLSFLSHKGATFVLEYVRQRIGTLAGKQEPLLTVVKRRKLTWFGHVNRQDSLAQTILQGTGGRQTNKGRRMVNEGKRMVNEGRRMVNEGRRMVNEGRRMVNEGRRMVNEGRRMVNEGRRMDNEGRRMVNEGRRMVNEGRNSEERTREKERAELQIVGAPAPLTRIFFQMTHGFMPWCARCARAEFDDTTTVTGIVTIIRYDTS
ncbi:hypothetical protein ACOMHN_023328 [Nucella lapillus]